MASHPAPLGGAILNGCQGFRTTRIHTSRTAHFAQPMQTPMGDLTTRLHTFFRVQQARGSQSARRLPCTVQGQTAAGFLDCQGAAALELDGHT